MKRPLLALCLIALAAPVMAQDGPPPGGEGHPAPRARAMRPAANPSAVIAAELAFARLAQDNGQWTAFRETAAADAVIFTPGMVLAQDWLRTRTDRPAAVLWRPHAVWSSCDGSLAVSYGAWRASDEEGAAQGWFTTVWQRQEDGGYKWVLDHGSDLAEPLVAPEMIPARVADCPARAEEPAAAPPPPRSVRERRRARAAEPAPAPFDPTRREGRSADGSLAWRVMVSPDGARRFEADFLKDGAMQRILAQDVAAEVR